MEERLQKIMAKAGLGSRRDCEQLISAGRVLVNGKVAILGSKADPGVDHIVVDGTPLRKAEALSYVALNKPRGVLSTADTPDSRQTVRDLVPLPGTLYPVGRLDVESEGLVLLTNDGDLANKLTHPRYGHEKEYRVLVAKVPIICSSKPGGMGWCLMTATGQRLPQSKSRGLRAKVPG